MPTIGVVVKSATLDSQPFEEFEGAEVDLLDRPVFEGRSGLAFEDVEEPIFPLHVQITGKDWSMQRAAKAPDGSFLQVKGNMELPKPELLTRFGVKTEEGRRAFRARRLAAVEEELARAEDELQRLSLELRKERLTLGPGIETNLLGGGMAWSTGLASESYTFEPGETPIQLVDDSAWSLKLWMGIWDADVLCGFVAGSLVIPAAPVP